MKSNSLGIRRYDYVEFYVGSAKTTAYWYVKAMGFDIIAYSGPETGNKHSVSYYLKQNDIKILVTSGYQPESYDIQSFVQKHGDGVKRWSLDVDSVEEAFEKTVSKGAIPVRSPKIFEDKDGKVVEAAIQLYDDTEIVFVNRDHYKGLFRPGFGPSPYVIQVERQNTGLLFIDHIVGNVRTNEMDKWTKYFEDVMDFEPFVYFGPGDISTQFSALLSRVVRSKDEIVKNPINEPYKGKRKSQIEEFIDEYRGTGTQHIAIASADIITTIKNMRKNGIEFLTLPDSYYELLKQKNTTLPKEKKITEDINVLKEFGILCDHEGDGYLLQLFTKPIGDRPTFFFEIIQRRNGSNKFGQGNFQALFESIEIEQAKRGNL